MKDRLENIDDLFKENQGGFERQPSATAWSRLENLLDQVPEQTPIETVKPKPSSKTYLKWLSIAALLALLTLPLIWFQFGSSAAKKDMAVAAKQSSSTAKEYSSSKKTARNSNRDLEAAPIIAQSVEKREKIQATSIESENTYVEKDFKQSKGKEEQPKRQETKTNNNLDNKKSEVFAAINEEKLDKEAADIGKELVIQETAKNKKTGNIEVLTEEVTEEEATPIASTNPTTANTTAPQNAKKPFTYNGDAGDMNQPTDKEIAELDTGTEAEEISEEPVYNLGTIQMERSNDDGDRASTYENTGNYYEKSTTYNANALPLQNSKYNPLIGKWSNKEATNQLEVYRIDPNIIQFNFIEDKQLTETVTLSEDADGITLKHFSTTSSQFYVYNENEFLSNKKTARFETPDGKSIEIVFSNKNKIKWRSNATDGQKESIFIRE